MQLKKTSYKVQTFRDIYSVNAPSRDGANAEDLNVRGLEDWKWLSTLGSEMENLGTGEWIHLSSIHCQKIGKRKVSRKIQINILHLLRNE